jgi:hypothetical protein
MCCETWYPLLSACCACVAAHFLPAGRPWMRSLATATPPGSQMAERPWMHPRTVTCYVMEGRASHPARGRWWRPAQQQQQQHLCDGVGCYSPGHMCGLGWCQALFPSDACCKGTCCQNFCLKGMLPACTKFSIDDELCVARRCQPALSAVVTPPVSHRLNNLGSCRPPVHRADAYRLCLLRRAQTMHVSA